MGLVPIHVYTDRPWVPYEGLFLARAGFATSVGGLEDLLHAEALTRPEVAGEALVAFLQPCERE